MAYGLFGWDGLGGKTRGGYHRNYAMGCFGLRNFFFLFCEIWLLLSTANGEKLTLRMGKSSGGVFGQLVVDGSRSSR